MLNKNQIRKLSKLIWMRNIEDSLPNLKVWLSTYINIPAPRGVKPDEVIKKIVLASPLENTVTIDEKGRLNTSFGQQTNSLILETIYVTKSLLPSLIDHRKDGIDWTDSEVKILLEKL